MLLQPPTSCFRADPTASIEAHQQTPVEIAAAMHHTEVLDLLAEYTDASGVQKLEKILRLMYEEEEYADFDPAEEFKKALTSLPVDLVG